MKEENSLQRMMNRHAQALPEGIERSVIHQASTFCVFGQVVELFGPSALNVVSRYICGHPDCHDTQGPQVGLDEEVPFWRVKP